VKLNIEEICEKAMDGQEALDILKEDVE